jgi:hypothetical protein
MSNWIVEEATKASALERNIATKHTQAKERYLHIQARWSDYWQSVVRVVQDEVAAFNRELHTDSLQHLTIGAPTGG